MIPGRVRYIFTYGTLMACCIGRQGAAERAQIAAQCAPRGGAVIRGRLFDTGPCPAAVVVGAAARDRVHGEVWELPADHADLLEVLDIYEGCGPDSVRPCPYVRRRIRVRTADGRRVTAWMYVWTRSLRGLPFVAGGRWRERADALQSIAACGVVTTSVKRGAEPPAWQSLRRGRVSA